MGFVHALILNNQYFNLFIVMEQVCLILLGVNFLVFIIGMIKPTLFVPNKFNIKKKRGFIFLISVVLFLVFSSIGAYNAPPVDTSVNKFQQGSQAISTQGKDDGNTDSSNETKPGDFIAAGNDFKIEVIKIKDKKRNAVILEGGYGKYRYYYLKITNISKYPKDIDRDNFSVVSADGAHYKHNYTQAITDFIISINRDAFAGEELPPNVPAKGIIAFEVPKEGKYTLQFNQ
jgi:hypothetical protein